MDGNCVYTSTSPSGSYRAFGACHLQWIGESQVDEVARRAGIDPLELRRRNLLTPGELVRPTGGKPLDADLVGDVEKVAEAIGWDETAPPGVGRGLSVGLLAAGAHPVSRASVRLAPDGAVEVNVGTTEVGQGARTVMAQIAAQELAIDTSRVVVQGADTAFTPYDRSTGASRSTTLAGLAVQRAAADLRRQLLETAGGVLGADPETLVVARRSGLGRRARARLPRASSRRASASPAARSSAPARCGPSSGSGSYAEGPVFWEVCVAAAEVEVERETGEVHVRKVATCADVGKAINPQLVQRQDEGGAIQGLGNALFEEMIFTDGLLVNDTLLDYRVPRVKDLPGRDAHRRRGERGRPGAVRGKGLRRGRPGGRPGCDRDRARRRGRARPRAAGHAGAGLEANTRHGTRRGGSMTAVAKAAIIGTGTMGPGMGAVLERAGVDVALYDVSEEQLEKARPGVDLARSVLDRLGGEGDGAGGAGLRFESDLAAALDGADMVVEAVPEKLELKQQVFAEFEQHVAPEAILASNTSGIPITKIAENLEHPERVIGTHWSNPPHLIPMIEIIPGERTSPEVTATTQELVAADRLLPLHAQEGGPRASSRTGCSTRSCASASPSWTRESWTPRSST